VRCVVCCQPFDFSTGETAEHRDGSRRPEGVIRDPELEDEPGAAELPEAGRRPSIDYATRSDQRSSSRRAQSEALIQAQYRGEADWAA
jgi:hypothetical protein